MKCSISDFQPFPHTGRLQQNMNLSLCKLREIIGDTQAKVYSYIVATVKNHNGDFVQMGSAPNFQGGVISLCTCKHYMRTFLDVGQWPNIWIAGFTGTRVGNKRNVLFYLMKVKYAFESHCDLWYSENLSDTVKQAKLAHKNKNRFGDVFQPKSKLKDKRDEFDFEHYHPPVADHVHAPKDWWHKDINYTTGVRDRKPALLLGDPQYSFLWNKPTLFHLEKLYHGQRKDDLQPFLHDCLHEIKDKQ
jgi:hypothetical protein